MMISSLRMHALAAATAVALGTSPLAASTARAASPAPQHGGSLTMVRADPLQSLLPSLPTDNASIWIIEEVFDTLLLPRADGLGVTANLATSWTQAADGVTWTFKLRHGVKFSNGQPLTSKDVKFSLEQTSKPSSPFAFINAAIAEITTPDDDTVVIRTKEPFAPLPAAMAIFSNSIVPYDYAGMKPEDFAKHPIGSGPFVLKQWTPGVGVTLERNKAYWQEGKPYLDSVVFREVADANTRANEVRGGQAQIDEFPAYSSIQALKAAGNVKVGIYPSSRVDFLIMNTTRAPFNDLHVRRAIASAIDKKALIKVVLFGHGEPAGAYMSPSSWAHDASIKGLPYDMAAAKAELAKSSVPHGFSTTITVPSGNSDQAMMAQIVQASLAKIGIKLAVQALDPSAISQAKRGASYDMAFSYDTTDIVDPDEIIRFVGSYGGGSNALYTSYKNKDIDEWIAKAATLNDQAARTALYHKIQQQWNTDQPAVPLYYSPEVYVYSNNVHNFHPFVTGNYNLANVWMSK